MKTNYPIAFEFLINMRNLFIANRILVSEKQNPYKKIVVILGAAHVELVNKLIEG
jgi:pheromone shutdown protein TraB